MVPMSTCFTPLSTVNTTCIPSPNYINFTNSPFSPTTQVFLFFVGICLVLIMTTHSPLPKNQAKALGQIIDTVLGPITSGVESFNSITLFAIKIARGDWPRCLRPGNEMMSHDALSAGALAVRIPSRFQSAIEESPLGWRILGKNVPLLEQPPDIGRRDSRQRSISPDSLHDDTILYSIPPTSRIADDNLQLFPKSNKLNTIISVLQLVYSAYQMLWQYGSMIRDQGLASPFIITFGYLFVSFLNLFANLVQGSYTNVTVISPRTTADTENTESRAPIPNSSTASESTETLANSEVSENHYQEANAVSATNIQPPITLSHLDGNENDPQPSDPHDLAIELDKWLRIHHPQIEIIEYPSLSYIAFFLHYSIALGVLVTWIGMLTRFAGDGSSSQMLLLLAVVAEPILHLMLQTAQVYTQRLERLRDVMDRVAVTGIKLVSWALNLIGWLIAAKSLYQIYKVIPTASAC